MTPTVLASEPTYADDTLLAFIDILGFKRRLEKNGLPEIVRTMRRIPKADNSLRYAAMLEIKTRLISDSLVVWATVTEPKHVTAFLVFVGTLIGKIHRLGNVLTRGCIASGNHYASEELWISPVFVAAYEAEQARAIHPRTILHETAVDRINLLDPSFLTSGWFRTDADGFRYVNYLMCASEAYQPSGSAIILNLASPGLRDALLDHRRTICAGLAGDRKHRSKYIWLANYHNAYVGSDVNLAGKSSWRSGPRCWRSEVPVDRSSLRCFPRRHPVVEGWASDLGFRTGAPNH